jgi:hypothetical protein
MTSRESGRPNVEVWTDAETDTLNLRYRLSRAERHEMSLRQYGDYQIALALLLSSMRPDSVYQDDGDAMADAMERAELVMLDEEFRSLCEFREDRDDTPPKR